MDFTKKPGDVSGGFVAGILPLSGHMRKTSFQRPVLTGLDNLGGA